MSALTTDEADVGDCPRLGGQTTGKLDDTVTTLKVNYAFLSSRLVATLDEPAARWRLLCELAQIRTALKSHGVRPWEFGVLSRAYGGFEPRMLRLLRDVLSHSGRPGLKDLVPDEPWAAHRFQPLLDELRRANAAADLHRTMRRAADGGYATVQEDLLSQELDAMARSAGPPAGPVRQVLAELVLLRARETALVCWTRMGGALRRCLPERPRVFSLGAGLAEFEETLVRETGAEVMCADIEATRHRYREGLSQFRVTPLEAYRPSYDDIDLLVLKDVLHHVRQPQWLIPVTAQAVRPGGTVLVVEPLATAGDPRALPAIRELDSTPHKSSVVIDLLWERWFRHAGLEIRQRFDFPPGVVDNNDSFPRAAWLLHRPRA